MVPAEKSLQQRNRCGLQHHIPWHCSLPGQLFRGQCQWQLHDHTQNMHASKVLLQYIKDVVNTYKSYQNQLHKFTSASHMANHKFIRIVNLQPIFYNPKNSPKNQYHLKKSSFCSCQLQLWPKLVMKHLILIFLEEKKGLQVKLETSFTFSKF